MPPTAEDRLRDILDNIALIERVTRGIDYQKFAGDEIIRGATERFLSIICEASLRLPENVKQEAPHIDWHQINGFGNLLRHAYHSTDTEEVWKIIQDHVPLLKAFVESRIAE